MSQKMALADFGWSDLRLFVLFAVCLACGAEGLQCGLTVSVSLSANGLACGGGLTASLALGPNGCVQSVRLAHWGLQLNRM